MNGQARKREAGDVDFLDRRRRILQAVERRLRDELQAGRAQLSSSARSVTRSRPASCSRSASEKPDTGTVRRRRDHFLITRRLPRCRSPARRRCELRRPPAGHDDRRCPGSAGDIRDAHERRARAVPLPARFVGQHAEGDDVVARREGVEFSLPTACSSNYRISELRHQEFEPTPPAGLRITNSKHSR